MVHNLLIHQVSQLLTSLNIDRFSTSFYQHIEQKIYNKSIIKDPTTLEMHRYTTLQALVFERIFHMFEF